VTMLSGYRRLLGVSALLYLFLFGGAALLLSTFSQSVDERARGLLLLGGTACLSAAGFVLLFIVLHRFVFYPLHLLSEGMRIVIGVNSAYDFELPRHHLLGHFPRDVEDLSTALLKAKREIAEALAAGASQMADTKSHLETVLSSIREAVIVCDDRARIVFYNPATRRVFQENEALGLGRSLYLLCARTPIENALAILRQRRIRHEEKPDSDRDVAFVCSTVDAGILLDCHIHLLPVIPNVSWSFVLTCEDISRQADLLGRKENQLRALVRNMRTPLTNLGVSVESLNLHPDLPAENRATFERIIAEESRTLIQQFESLAHEIQDSAPAHYGESDVFTGDLVACVTRQLVPLGIQVTMTGDPLWVRADSNSLLQLLEFLARKVHECTEAHAIEVQTLLGNQRVYFDFYWHGQPIPHSTIQKWLTEPLGPDSISTVSAVLDRHDSDIWSSRHSMPGYALLRLPMPLAPGQWDRRPAMLPERPVYHDFITSPYMVDAGPLKEHPLDQLTYVVFDTETTGLTPFEGDEVVSLAGVKIMNNGILLGEQFDHLVNPGRAIPRESVRFHGITDEMVKDRPGIDEVLRAFHTYTGDAVLVAHNAAFDMRFVRMKEHKAGVHFTNPVLDTLALSLYLHGHTPQHSLDSIAQRLGVEIRDRHTALGDSLITAEVFLRLLYLLREKGITTLGSAMEVSRR